MKLDITVIAKDELAQVSIKESLPEINKETTKDCYNRRNNKCSYYK